MAYKKIDDAKILEIAKSIREINGISESDKEQDGNKFSLTTTPAAIDSFKAPIGELNYSYTAPFVGRFDAYSGFKDTYMLRAVGNFDYTETYSYIDDPNNTYHISDGNAVLSRYGDNVKNDTFKAGIKFHVDNPNSYLTQLLTPCLYKQRVVYLQADNKTALNTEYVNYGEDAVYTGEPTKASDNMYDYEFSGWSTSSTIQASANLTNINHDMVVYPMFVATPNTFTVRYYNGSTLLYTDHVQYGGASVYGGASTTSLKDPQNRSGYKFWKWDRNVTYVTYDMDVNALFWATYNDLEIEDSWWSIANSCNDYEHSYRQKYSVGMWKTIWWDVAGGPYFKCRIVGIDVDDTTSGNKAALSFIMEDVGWYGYMIHSDDYMCNGWSGSSIKSQLDGLDYYLETSVYNYMKTALKISDWGSGAQITEDKLWVPSRKELGLSGGSYGCSYNSTAYTKVRNNLNFNPTDDLWDDGPLERYWTRDSLDVYGGPVDYTVFYSGRYGGSTSVTQLMARNRVCGVPVGFCL